ncbi:putative protein [Arabidopsis thaliana]|uniref:Uncharacterized protein AT4g22350 n=1 Tax=Arabidopsis thaliana TaxID=3702 RepID=O49640_ARATH|nr:putative protein [Arabidopsis thaliana]CAB79190.1 putative protein [Arabidopsis thaliana]
MKGEREVKNGVSEEEREVKRKRVMERSDSPPPPLGFNNPLLPFANAYDDDNNQQNKSQTRCNVVAKGEGNGNKVKGEAQVEVDDDEDDDDDASKGRGKHSRHVEVRRDCPYLDTVNRQVLDFDFERFCSVSLSNLNVYACLVCGKYFQGRSQKSHAYTHSLEAGHHVYINLLTEKVYCLPDSYEINDPSLDDIRHVLNPRFSRAQVNELDKNRQWSRALDGSDYLPGMVSPHEFLQAVMKASKKRFRIGQQSDPVEFMSWLLNTLHMDLRTSKDASSIIHKCFQGELEVVKEYQGNENKEISRMPFLMLGLDLPPPPLFKDVMEKNIIPQVALFDLLKKFDGETVTEVVRPKLARMRYRVIKSPRYLMFHMVRFKKNNFFKEKNPTLVNFPVKDMELRDYIPSLPRAPEGENVCSKYNLIANIVHDGKPEDGYFRVFVQRKSQELWYEMQDLHVAETLPQMVELSEAYMQIYEQQEE